MYTFDIAYLDAFIDLLFMLVDGLLLRRNLMPQFFVRPRQFFNFIIPHLQIGGCLRLELGDPMTR